MKAKIVILPGDGVGPEIVAEAVKVLDAVAHRFGHDFEMTEHPVGGAAYDTYGDCLPDTTLAACPSRCGRRPQVGCSAAGEAS